MEEIRRDRDTPPESQASVDAGLPGAPVTPLQIRAWAMEAGFSEAGTVAIPHVDEERNAARFEEWIATGRAGTMNYLKRTDPAPGPEPGGELQLLRARLRTPFPWARSVVVCFASYHADQPRSTDPAPQDTGWIARYAWSSRVDPQLGRRPSDYHKVLLKRMRLLEAKLRAQHPTLEARAFVDTGPVVERSLAVAAGLGWTGKNTCLIHPQLGSYGFLAVLVTSLELEAETVALALPDRCGSCTRCLQACPTGALIAPYQMDASRCIAYLTIEHKGPVDEALLPGMGRQVFGCDICQDVCPWNRKAPISRDPELEPRPELVNPTLEWLAGISESRFETLFDGSPVRRAGYLGLLRNVAIAMGNSGLRRWLPWLEERQESSDEGLRGAVRWALKTLRKAAH